METVSSSIIIYCDGACSGNPGPGGWGAVVVTPDGATRELGGGSSATTNNQMELTATIEALAFVANRSEAIRLFTDSTYVIKGITQWIWAWRKRNWISAEGKPVANRDYWERLFAVVSARTGKGTIDWQYVRGHSGVAGNERVDAIAVAFAKRIPLPLYQGPLSAYGIELTAPAPIVLDSTRKKSTAEKKGAVSYLSFVDNVPMRHRTWADCERRVKGRSGAKFKKVASASEEDALLKSWGVAPTDVKN